jgi:NAD(P)-dependent dehydrogenase (short-subunit alcohol dehydrogenase family)
MRGRVQGKKALITGGAQGLGAATAWALAREGAKVLLTDLNIDGAAQVAEIINQECGAGTAFSLRHDVTSEADWISVMQYARDNLLGLSGTVEELTLEQWHRGMAVNNDSVFLGCKYALSLLRDSQPAAIVNIASIAGLIAGHNLANYNASKAAVWLLTKSVALHCARQRWNIRCNSVHPAFVKTPILEDLVGDGDREVVMTKLAKQVPLGRLGEPVDVANAVVYLSSDESKFVTGAELKLDGGISAM